jgi:hypothetical protein
MAGNFVRVNVDTGGLQLAYRADLALALRYQRAMARDCPSFTVTIDASGDTSGLRPIPCASLFAES